MALPSPSVVAPYLKATARKSTTKGMKVAMFRSSLFNVRKNDVSVKLSLANADDCDDDLFVIDDSDNDSNGSRQNNECEAIDIDSPAEPISACPQTTNILRFCCHLCSYTVLALSPSALAQHLFDVHSDATCMPRVEILPANGDDNDDDEALFTQYRCGLCIFESNVQQDFDTHVLRTHGLGRPLVCDVCYTFASFSRAALDDHFVTVHSDLEPQSSILNNPYAILPVSGQISQRCYSLKALVRVEDLSKMSCSRLVSLLSSFGVTADLPL
jgi:hypothetical protein